ncbi:MAG: hypothetical protein QOI92_132 [Chloroflexota bacterium]|nr:hypothetical protein [Chloroflexota bacterium]
MHGRGLEGDPRPERRRDAERRAPFRGGRSLSYAGSVNIHALMLADSAQAVDGKLYILGGAWNVLRFPEFPSQLIVGIAVAIDVDWNETNRRHHLDVHFEDADGNGMQPTIGADFEAGRPPGAVAGADLRIVFAVNGPLSIPAPGAYSAVASVGGEVLARARFQAIQVARPS